MSDKKDNATFAKELRGLAMFASFEKTSIGKLLRDAADRIEYLSQFAEWKSIEELPSLQKGTKMNILVYIPKGKDAFFDFIETDDVDADGNRFFDKATHYLPLPPAPKVKK